MNKKEDKETRYFIDLDLATLKVLRWDYDDRHILIGEELAQPHYHRVYITKGQYNKLVQHHEVLIS